MKYMHQYCLFSLMLVSVLCFGQEEKKIAEEKKKSEKPKHEIRIITENLFGNNSLDNLLFSNQQFFQLENSALEYLNNRFQYGLGYNLNFNKVGIRTKVFYSSNFETGSPNSSFNNTSTEIKSVLFRGEIGINYQKQLDKVILFSGADFGFFKAYFYQENRGQNKNELNYTGLSIQPVVGFKYFLSKNFSISTEIRFIVDIYSGNSETTQSSNQGFSFTTNVSDFNGTSYRLGPKGSMSLNVHF